MRFDKFFKAMGPVAAMALAAGVAGCDNAKFRMDGSQGVPLAELDLSGEIPDSVNLLSADTLRIATGEDFTISLEGDDEAKEGVRFIFEDGALSVLRDGDFWNSNRRATITVTMPAPRHLVLAGSGAIYADALARRAEVTIAGSGKVETMSVDVETLDVNVAGSGSYRASGKAEELDLSIAGSGDARLDGLTVGKADVSIAGSGDTVFASDGSVEVRIMGSGNVTVRGEARCRVRSFGSGTLTCERGETVDGEEG